MGQAQIHTALTSEKGWTVRALSIADWGAEGLSAGQAQAQSLLLPSDS